MRKHRYNSLSRGEGGPEGVGRGMRAVMFDTVKCKDFLRGRILNPALEQACYVVLTFRFPPAFLFSQGIGSEEPIP